MLAVARDPLAFDPGSGFATVGAAAPSAGGGTDGGIGAAGDQLGDHVLPDVIDLNAEPAAGSLLSERQVEILQAIADGATTKQVARQLNITQKTVHNHLNAIYRRLDTQSLTHAVLSAVRLGIIELE
jgi:DNA-binding CsgD family transcriptional regulator